MIFFLYQGARRSFNWFDSINWTLTDWIFKILIIFSSVSFLQIIVDVSGHEWSAQQMAFRCPYGRIIALHRRQYEWTHGMCQSMAQLSHKFEEINEIVVQSKAVSPGNTSKRLTQLRKNVILSRISKPKAQKGGRGF